MRALQSTIVRLLALPLLLLTSLHCSKEQIPTNPNGGNTKPNEKRVEGDLTLSATPTKIVVGEKITFTAIVGEDLDVTSDATLKIFLKEATSDTPIDGVSYAPQSAGEYIFYATCSVNPNETLTSQTVEVVVEAKPTTEPEESLEGDLTLQAPNSVAVGEAIHFVAKVGTSDVSDNPNLRIYHKGESGNTLVEELSYTPTTEGDHSFYAICIVNDSEIKQSEEIVVYASSNGDEFDTQVDKYDSFIRRVAAFEITGTWCSSCPAMIKAMHDYQSSDRADDVVFVACHNNDELTSNVSKLLVTYFFSAVSSGDQVYPNMRVGSINNDGLSIIYDMDSATVMEKINNIVDDYKDEGAKSAIGASVTLAESDKIDVKARIKIGKNGNFSVGALLLEDGIYAYQSYSGGTSLGGIDINNHINVLHSASNPKYPFYNNLGDVKQHTAKSCYNFECSFDTYNIDNVDNVDNCKVVIFTYDNDTHKIDNIVEVALNQTKKIDYTK